MRFKAQQGQVKRELGLVQDTENDLLTEEGWQGRDPEVDLFALPVVVDADLDAPVLGYRGAR